MLPLVTASVSQPCDHRPGRGVGLAPTPGLADPSNVGWLDGPTSQVRSNVRQVRRRTPQGTPEQHGMADFRVFGQQQTADHFDTSIHW